MNLADLCRYRMPGKVGFRQRAVMRNFGCARRRGFLTQPFADRARLKVKRAAIVYVPHALIACSGDDDKTLLPAFPIKRRLPDGQKNNGSFSL